MDKSNGAAGFQNEKDNNEKSEGHVNIKARTLGGAASSATADFAANSQSSKFTAKGGTGFAAEDANDLADRIAGRKTFQVGGDNAADGADRIVDGVVIQTKYFANANDTVNSAFNEAGFYRYGKMQLEVPSDQYDAAVEKMRELIKEGKVPGFTKPKEAEVLVRKGNVTYRQARNIARPGNVDSLTYDAKTGAVISAKVFAISFLVSFARCTWDEKSAREAVMVATATGLQSAGTAFLTNIVASQFMRTQSARSGTVFIRAGLKHVAKTKVGKVTIQKVAEASAGKALRGAAAQNHVSKLLRNNVITGVVTTAVLTAPDVYRAALKKNTSWAQVGKNLLVNGSSVAAGTAGWMSGAVAGAAAGSVVPFVGTAVGGFVGGMAGAMAAGWGGSAASKYVLDHFIEDDAQEMVTIIREVLVTLAEEYMLSEDEFAELSQQVLASIGPESLREMYASEDREQYAVSNYEVFCEEIAKARNLVKLPADEQVRHFIEEMLLKAAQESLEVQEEEYDPAAYVPNFTLIGEPRSIAQLAIEEAEFGIVNSAKNFASNAFSKVFGKAASTDGKETTE